MRVLDQIGAEVLEAAFAGKGIERDTVLDYAPEIYRWLCREDEDGSAIARRDLQREVRAMVMVEEVANVTMAAEALWRRLVSYQKRHMEDVLIGKLRPVGDDLRLLKVLLAHGGNVPEPKTLRCYFRPQRNVP